MDLSNTPKNIENIKLKILSLFILLNIIIFSMAYLFSTIHEFLGTLEDYSEIRWTTYVLLILMSLISIKFLSFLPSSSKSSSESSQSQDKTKSHNLSFQDAMFFEKISSKFLFGLLQGIRKIKKV